MDYKKKYQLLKKKCKRIEQQKKKPNMIDCFDYFKTKCRKLHEETLDKPDGLVFWRKYKKHLEAGDSKFQWNLESTNSKLLEIKRLVINGHVPEHKFTWQDSGEPNIELIEANHFLIQLFRLPRKDQCSIRKIMQVALNLGQLEANIEKTTLEYSHKILLKELLSLNSNDLFHMFIMGEKGNQSIKGLMDILRN